MLRLHDDDRKPWVSVSVAAVALTTFLIVVAWHIGRLAWYDESWVVEFARVDSPVQTLAAAELYSRPLPLGYGFLMHVIADIFDRSLWAYRIPSILSGLALLGTTSFIGWRLSKSWPLSIAASITFILCPILQRYFTEIKQYILAAAVSVALIAAADWWAATGRRLAAYIWLALALVAILFTFSAWFAVVGSSMVLFIYWLYQRNWPQLLRTTGLGFVSAAVLLVVYLLFVRYISQSDSLTSRWDKEMLPLSLSYPADLWLRFKTIFADAWYRYSIPGSLALAAAFVGWCVWLWRQPIAALIAAATLAFTCLANLLKVWPLAAGARVRINLPLVTIIHLCLVVLPLGLFGAWRLRKTVNGNQQLSPSGPLTGGPLTISLFDGAAVIAAAALACVVLIESHSADYRVAAIDQLLRQLAVRPTSDDLVILTEAPFVNADLQQMQIKGTVVRGPWPDRATIKSFYVPTLRSYTKRVWLADGHHNPSLAHVWSDLQKAISPYGELKLAWSDQLVALYCFVPKGSMG